MTTTMNIDRVYRLHHSLLLSNKGDVFSSRISETICPMISHWEKKEKIHLLLFSRGQHQRMIVCPLFLLVDIEIRRPRSSINRNRKIKWIAFGNSSVLVLWPIYAVRQRSCSWSVPVWSPVFVSSPSRSFNTVLPFAPRRIRATKPSDRHWILPCCIFSDAVNSIIMSGRISSRFPWLWWSPWSAPVWKDARHSVCNSAMADPRYRCHWISTINVNGTSLPPSSAFRPMKSWKSSKNCYFVSARRMSRRTKESSLNCWSESARSCWSVWDTFHCWSGQLNLSCVFVSTMSVCNLVWTLSIRSRMHWAFSIR